MCQPVPRYLPTTHSYPQFPLRNLSFQTAASGFAWCAVRLGWRADLLLPLRDCWLAAPSRPLGRKHDASSIGSLVDLRPVPRFKRMNGGVLGLRSQVFGNGNVEIGIGLAPDEQH